MSHQQRYSLSEAHPSAQDRFTLNSAFLDVYKSKKAPFGFNGLGEFVYKRTYARLKEDGLKEDWWETVRRVVEGTYTIQKRHIQSLGLGWDEAKAQRSAQEMYDRIFTLKFTPPGRGLWMMGTKFVEERGGAALNNCAFISTKGIDKDFAYPFCFMMDASMLGVGVGFDCDGYGKVAISASWTDRAPFPIDDTREGWVASVRALLTSYLPGEDTTPVFDYSKIRPAGAPIKGFGGVASGPQPLKNLHENIRNLLDGMDGQPITKRAIVDMMNMIGQCVVAGNVRRTAQIALGDNSEEYLSLKDYKWDNEKQQYVGPMAERAAYGWASNNTVKAEMGQDYSKVAERIANNGEPGLFWQTNVQKFGRMNGKAMLDLAIGVNPCVPAGTRILTDEGYFPIESLVGSKVRVWNGNQWSQVSPRVTGHDQPLVKVTLSDGTHLTCTTKHEWVIHGERGEPSKVEAKDLGTGAKLAKFDMPVVTGGAHMPDAYEHGFFCGDGQDNGHSKGALLYGAKKALVNSLNSITESPKEDAYGRIWVGFSNSIPDKTFVPMESSLQSRLDWFAGLLDADGCALPTPNGATLQITSVDLEFLQNVRLMLTTLGVQAKVTKNKDAQARPLPDGKGGTKVYECQTLYRLLVNTTDTYKLKTLGLETRRVEIPDTKPQRDARRFVTVESVEPAGVADVVYCFTEPINHTGTFEGIVTGQCAEQPLESGEMCTLVETFPAHHDSLDDFKRTLKFAYLYAKTVTLTRTHWVESNRVMLRNRRIGVSMSGVAQFVAKHGMGELVKWSNEGYNTVDYYDDVYSNWLAIPHSVRVTTIKPSGTVSLLAGATPGMHFPESRFYIRRVRVPKNSDMWEKMQSAGYHVEPDKVDPSAMVVEIPVDVGEGVRTLKDVTMWEQLSLAALLQRHWSDNAVSVTVTFGKDEAKDIASALDYFQWQLKTVSLLPRNEGGGAYAQMPYEPIDEATYREKASNIRTLTLDSNEDAVGTKFCDSESCSI